MDKREFESLRVWQNARVFVNAIYDLMIDNKDWGFVIKYSVLQLVL